MISRTIAWCARNPFLVFTGAILLVGCRRVVAAARAARRAARHQRRAGRRSHQLGRRAARTSSKTRSPIPSSRRCWPRRTSRACARRPCSAIPMSSSSFEDGTDLYWARSRVTEYLQQIAGQAAGGRASRHRSGRDRRGLGLRVRHRRPHAHSTASPICARFRTGICATSLKPFPAWRRWRASADSCASTR